MPYIKPKKKIPNSTAVISLSFLAVIILGTILLMMPFSSASGKFTDPLTAFFTSVSATCVTGLVVVDTGSYWSVFGQLVILAMIQVGGLGLVTLVSFFNFMLGRKMELHSIRMASESVNSNGFGDVRQMVKRIIVISAVCELIGAVLLMMSYVPKFGLKGVYMSFYLSVTAFCNAGFDVMGTVAEPFSSLMSLSNDPVTIIVIPLLIISGGLGFFAWNELLMYVKERKLSFQARLVLVSTGVLVISGTLLIMLFEWNNPDTLGGKGFLYKLGNSFFSSVTLRTAGFNTIDTAAMSPLSKIFSIFYMFIGVAPGSTGGGIKITTFVIVVMTVVCVLTDKSDTVIIGRRIEKQLVYKALSIMLIFISIVLVPSIFITFTNEGITGLDTAYEITSAISTTGLSTGVTAECNVLSRILLCVIMFIGRVGPVSLALSLSMTENKNSRNEVYPEGRLMVG